MNNRAFLLRWLGGSMLAALASGCAGSAPLPKPAAAVKAAAPPPAPKPAKERLLASLRSLERPAPVLDVLPAEAQSVLETRLKALSPEQREQLLHGELGQAVPLLHLKAGGSSGTALFALATTPAATLELPLAFESASPGSDAERLSKVRLAHDLALRAAQYFLRDRVLDVANAPAVDLPPLLAAIERVAIAAERPDLVRLALETWTASGATADVLGRLAAACAYDQDDKCFQEAQAGVPDTAPEQARLQQLKKALKTRNDGDPIVKAWALLQLGRYADARHALGPVEAKAKTDLRVAAALAVVAADGTACPGLQPQVGSPRLCADAVTARVGLAPALADMNAAWQSGAGRDAASAEAYVGLAHVVPWVTALALATDAAGLERDFTERYQALARVLQDLPEQKPLAVFAAALSAGVTAGLHMPHGERPQIDSNRKQELWFGALGVEAAAPRLAVSSVLAADQPVLQLLPASAPPNLVPARAGLLAWEAAGGADPSVLESARAALAEQLSVSPKGSTDSASAVLLLAELDEVSTPSERTHKALAQISSQLIGEALPPELALRAVLDAAGALERLGRTADALGVLTKAAEIESLPGPAGDLLALIRAEKLVLAWDAKKDPQRTALAKALAALELGSAPPTVAFVVGAWASPKVLRQAKQTPKALLEQRIGVRAAELMAKGALRGTRVSLRVSYAFQTGVTPEVTFDPMFVPLVRPELIQKAL
jgi:tetratricopeptide (TPR) repeat protein